MLGGMEGLSKEDQTRMLSMIENLQLGDSLKMYNSLVERCFNDCIDSFTRKSLQKQEEKRERRMDFVLEKMMLKKRNEELEKALKESKQMEEKMKSKL